MNSALVTTLVVMVCAVIVSPAQARKPAKSAASVPPGTNPAAISVKLSPIPLYPDGGAIPSELSENFLFLDPVTQNLVVSYPNNVADPNYARTPGPRTVLRVELKRNVNVIAYVSFGKDSSGRHTYSYVLANQRDAKQELGLFSLPVPAARSDFANASVSGRVVFENSSMIQGGATGWTSRTSPADKGIVRLEWSPDSVSGIRPGDAASGFVAASTLRPGFVHATVRGVSPGPELSKIPVPLPVAYALAKLEHSGFNGRTLLTLGPQFSASASTIVVVANFLEGITALKQHQFLDATAPYVAEASAVLTRFLEGAQYAGDGPAADYVGPPLVIQQKPASPLEVQIHEAMKVSLPIR